MYRILYLIDTGRIGGAENILYNLVTNLDKKLYRPVVICGSEGPLVDKLKNAGVKVHVLKMSELLTLKRRIGRFMFYDPLAILSNAFKLAFITLRLLYFLIKNRFDLVHTHSLQAKLCGSIAAKLTGTRLIWHVHNIQPLGFRRRVVTFMADRFPEVVITVSNAVRESYIPFVKCPEKILVVHNGIDLSRYKISPPLDEKERGIRREFGIDSQTSVVAIASLLRPWKGHRYFLEAAAKVKKQYANVKFLIIGDEPLAKDKGYKRSLISLASRLGISEDVIFTGIRQDIPKILSQIDVLVSASILPEPFPTIILEAMAAAKPVVATKLGGVSEMVDDGVTGFLIPPKDPNAMAEAILGLLKDGQKAKNMGLEGRKKAEKLFCQKRFVAEVEKIYRMVLERS